MFKVGKFEKITDEKIEISTRQGEVHNYREKLFYKYNYLEFTINGKINDNDYFISFYLEKPIEKLFDIELNTCVSISDYVYEDDVLFRVNDVFCNDAKIKGKIYRIINKTIVITGFIISDNYCVNFEIEFNLDDYLNIDRKSDV